MQPERKEPSPLLRFELEQAIVAFVRGLVAADYSARTIRASLTDLRQFVAFLEGREVERLERLGRADVAAFVASLADPAGCRVHDDHAPLLGAVSFNGLLKFILDYKLNTPIKI